MALSSRGGLTLVIKVESERVQHDLVDFAVKMKRPLGEVIRQQMRLLVTDLMKLTPPFGSRAARNESFGHQRRIGQNAIARDVSRIFVSVEQIAKANTRLGPAIKTALDADNMEVLGHKNSLPELLVQAKVMETPDRERILSAPTPELHNRFRNLRGRVAGRLPYPIFIKRTAALKNFIQELWDEVGVLKGGWGAAAKKFGASAPQWISRHFSGEVVDQTEADDNPFALARNEIPYMESQNTDLQVTVNALKDRRTAMERQIKAYTDRTHKI